MKTIKVSPIELGKYDLRSTNKYMLNKIVHQKSKIVNKKIITCMKATYLNPYKYDIGNLV